MKKIYLITNDKIWFSGKRYGKFQVISTDKCFCETRNDPLREQPANVTLESGESWAT